ncbi:hypothetical protein PMAYCL1PPCAC_24055, partial [Pristionchus mayeri]
RRGCAFTFILSYLDFSEVEHDQGKINDIGRDIRRVRRIVINNDYPAILLIALHYICSSFAMFEANLPLLEEETVHQIILNGHHLSVKTSYDKEMATVQILGEDESTCDLINVPLLMLFQFRDKQVYRSSRRDTWSTELEGNSVKPTEFITLKIDKEQIINTNGCSKYLRMGGDFDIVLLCVNYRIHANKQKLAEKCDYFKGQEEIVDIDGETLHSVIMISDGARYRITDFNVEPIMNVADRFGMDEIMYKCADHLSIHSKLGEFKRLHLLDRYNQDDCIDELISTIKRKVSIREDKEFDDLSDRSQLKILRQAIEELKRMGGKNS